MKSKINNTLKKIENKTNQYANKSTITEIRERFDNDVERFSNLETGQLTTIDAQLNMELITQAAVASTPVINRVLDLGCGAGNNTLKLLAAYGDFDVHLVDLSLPMLTRAKERVDDLNKKSATIHQADMRNLSFASDSFDVIMAAAVLHHLREDSDWLTMFQKLFDMTAPGGSVWITDLVAHDNNAIQELMWSRYGEYLVSLEDEAYRDKVFAYVEKEDSPRSVTYQLELLKSVGFKQVDILHKNSTFAAFGAVKSASV